MVTGSDKVHCVLYFNTPVKGFETGTYDLTAGGSCLIPGMDSRVRALILEKNGYKRRVTESLPEIPRRWAP